MPITMLKLNLKRIYQRGIQDLPRRRQVVKDSYGAYVPQK